MAHSDESGYLARQEGLKMSTNRSRIMAGESPAREKARKEARVRYDEAVAAYDAAKAAMDALDA